MKTHDARWRDRAGDSGSEPVSRAYLEHRKMLLTYCAYVIGDRDIAQDIVQESFLRFVKKSQESGTPERVRDWLFICARNLCFNHLRSRRTRDRYSPVAEPPDGIIDIDSRRFIQRVLSRMDARERDLILLREVHRYSIREIAVMIHASEEAVRVRLYRIRKKMQEIGRQ